MTRGGGPGTYAVIFLFLASLSAGPVLGAQDFPEYLHITPENPAAGDDIRVIITLPYGPDLPEVTVKNAPDALELTEGSFVEPGIRISENGRAVRVYRIYLGFKSTEPGYAKLPEIEVKTGPDIQTYAGLYIPIAMPVFENTVIPPLPRWMSPRREIYINETVVLRLIFQNAETPDPRISIPGIPVPDSFVEVLAGTGVITEKVIQTVSGPVTLYEIEAGNLLITPQEGGTLVVPEIALSIDGYELPVPGISISLKSPPPAAAAAGAVGQFALAARFEEPAIPGGIPRLYVRISGTGNLPFIVMPEPLPHGLELARLEETESISLTPRGYSGFRETAYAVQGIQADAYVSIPAFTWIDSDSETLETADPVMLTAPPNRETPKQPVSNTAEQAVKKGPKPALEKIPEKDKGLRKIPALYARPYWVCVYIPGAVLIVLGIRKRRAAGPAALLTLLFLFAFSGRAGSEIRYESKGNMRPYQWYNQGVDMFNVGKYPEAVWSFRQALKADPMNASIRKTLLQTENYLSLRESIKPVPRLNPDIPLVVSAFMLFLFGVLLAVNTKRGMREILGILLFLALASGAAFGYAYRRFSFEEGVLKTDTVLLRVPAAASSAAGSLEKSVSVRILGGFGDFTRIRTGTGLEAWVPSDSLLFLD